MSDVVCRCDTEGSPRCGFCEDDLFCPQCGDKITRVFSRDRHEESNVIWIYADEDTGEFRFSLSSEARGSDRRKVPGLPQLYLEQSRLHVADRFDPNVEEIGSRADGLGTEYRLKPRAEEAAHPDWVRLLPPEGLAAWLDAVGAFNEQRFDFRICQSPQFDVRLHGADIRDDEDVDQSSWRIGKQAQLKINLEVEARTAPVYLKSELRVMADDPADDALFKLEGGPAAGEKLSPGQALSMTLTVNARNWDEGEAKVIALRLDYGVQVFTKLLRLRMVPWGSVQFQPSFLPLPDLRLGDRLDSKDKKSKLFGVCAVNDGSDGLYLNEPEVVVEAGPPAAKWLKARWLGDLLGEELVTLQPGERRLLDLEIDLSQINAQDLPPDRQLKAAIVVRDDKRPWRLPIVISNLTSRPLHKGWLAIDFGSTNSYAAVSESQPGTPHTKIVPLLNTEDPERFDSVMFIKEARNPPDYLVGPEAAEQGELEPTALISGMKRVLGLPGPPREFSVMDPGGRVGTYDVETLVKLMLKDILRRCEDALRERVEKIGLSFPANYGPDRIAALKRVAQRLADEWAAEDPPRRLECDPPRLDEATAVVLGFALDPQNPRIEPLVRDKQSLVVASLDFGGGTLDTAVIRMHFEGPFKFATYSSTYLGIGGDANLGGENVTLSVQELLVGRLLDVMREALGPEPMPELKLARRGERGTPAARTNFEVLWRVAERVKIALCTAAAAVDPAAAALPALNDALATHLLPQLSSLRGEFRAGDEVVERLLVENEAVRIVLEEAATSGRLHLSLDEIYDHQIACDLRGQPGLPIRQRLTRCVEELAGFAERHGEQIDVVVLAGAAARLPLVEALIRDRLPTAIVEFDRQNPKSKVASGLIRYLTLREDHTYLVDGIACPLDFLQEPIAVRNPARLEFIEVVAAWNRINDPSRWYPLEGIPLDRVWSSDRRLELWTVGYDGNESLGTFDLSLPGTQPPDQPETLTDLPAKLPREHRAELRFAEGRQRIEMRVVSGPQCFGYWTLMPPVART